MKVVFLENLENLFRQHNMRFLYIGSYALSLYYTEALCEFTPPDIDILIKGSYANIISFLHEIPFIEGHVEIWGEKALASWTENFLVGKWYMRVFQEQLVIDISFEYPYLDFEQSWAHRVQCKQHILASVEDIWYLKCLQNPERSSLFAKTYGLEIPANSIRRQKEWCSIQK